MLIADIVKSVTWSIFSVLIMSVLMDILILERLSKHKKQ